MRKLIYFCLALFWTSAVAYSCLMPSDELPSITIPYFDKLVHVGFHFGITLFWFLYLNIRFNWTNIYKALLLAFVFSVLFGIGIEIAQGFYTQTRSQDVADVLSNTIGGCLAIVIALRLRKHNIKF